MNYLVNITSGRFGGSEEGDGGAQEETGGRRGGDDLFQSFLIQMSIETAFVSKIMKRWLPSFQVMKLRRAAVHKAQPIKHYKPVEVSAILWFVMGKITTMVTNYGTWWSWGNLLNLSWIGEAQHQTFDATRATQFPGQMNYLQQFTPHSTWSNQLFLLGVWYVFMFSGWKGQSKRNIQSVIKPISYRTILIRNTPAALHNSK